jgi:aminocarboxymuconate-semialdehyde decarboxylase
MGTTYPHQPVEKWDVHTHTTLPPHTCEALARFGNYADFIRVRAHATKPTCAELVNHRGQVQRVVSHTAYDAAARLIDCDSHGVTMQVLSPTPMMIPDYVDQPADAAEICRILNDANAEIVARHPSRFVALAALPMMFADLAIQEMERVRRLGMRGIEINSNVHGLELSDPRFLPIFESAQDMNMAVFVHPWAGFMIPTEERLLQRMHANHNWRPWLVAMGMETALAFDALRSGGVHERLTKLRVLYAHGGGVFPALLGRLEHGAYCRPDLFQQASRKDPYQTVRDCGVYTDALTHDPWVLQMLVHTLGAGRVAMGSDYPYPLGELDPFDGERGGDTNGNVCPYPNPKGIYPGHMIEHLPSCEDDMADAWQHFHWLPRHNIDGQRSLPMLSLAQKKQLLSGTAKEWLGYS